MPSVNRLVGLWKYSRKSSRDTSSDLRQFKQMPEIIDKFTCSQPMRMELSFFQ